MRSSPKNHSSLDQISFSVSDTAIPSISRVGSRDAYLLNGVNQGSRLPSLGIINSQKALFLDQHALREGEQLRSNLFQHHDSFLRRFQENNESSQSVNELQSEISHSPSVQITPRGITPVREDTSAVTIEGLHRQTGKLKSNLKHHTAFVANEINWNGNKSALAEQNTPMIASTPNRNIAIQRHQNKIPSNLINNLSNSIQMYESSNESQVGTGGRRNFQNYEGTEISGGTRGFAPTSKFQFALKKVQTVDESASVERGGDVQGLDVTHSNQNNLDEEKKKQRMSRVSILGTSNKTSFKLFKKVNLVKKFASLMLSFLQSRNMQRMQYRHYQIINDKIFHTSHKEFLSHEDQNETIVLPQQPWAPPHQGQSQFHAVFGTNPHSSFQYKLSKAFTKVSGNILYSIPIFMPNNLVQIFWNIIFLIYLLIFFALSPLLTIFEDSHNDAFLTATEEVGIVIIAIHVLLILNTGYYHEGEVVKSRLLIFKRYMRVSLWIDISTIACLLIVMSHPDMQYLKLICLLRLMQIMKLLNNIEEHFQLQQKFYTTYELSKLFALVFFVAHYCGCIFYFISRIDYDNNSDQSSWIKKYNVANNTWDSLYLDGLYFSIITMVTVGYGDIVPISSNEKIFVILFSIVSCGIFGYAVNTIGAIFQELSQKQASYKLKKYEITRYMEGRNIQRTSQIKVLKYLEYMNSQEEERNFLQRGEFILSNISKNLRDEVTRDFFRRILLGSNIFINVFSNKLVDQLALVMKEITLGPGDIIFNKGDLDNKFYFVFKGTVEHTLEQENRIIKFGNYIVGDYFGQCGFFADLPRKFTAKSKGNSHIVFCKREDMLRLVQENPLDLEAFSMMRDDILFKNEINGHKCLLCSNPNHDELKCDLVNVRLNRPLLILKNNYTVEQQRSKSHCNRRDPQKFPKLNKTHQNLIRVHLKKFRADCVLEAFENSEDTIIFQDNRMSDKDFFLRLPKVKYHSETAKMIEETEDSIYSDEDIELFSKEGSRNQQDFESQTSQQTTSVQNIQAPLSHVDEKRKARMKSRHQTAKVNFTPPEEITSWNQMFRSKTRNEGFFNVNSPSQRITKNVHEQDRGSSIIFDEFPKRTDKRNNTGATAKTHKTLQRNDSMSSIKSLHKDFNRNASRQMSHFGAAAVNSGMVSVSSQPKIPAETPKAMGQILHQPSTPLIPLRDSQIRYERQLQQSEILKEQFASSYQTSIQDQEFDVVKEYTIYYPTNNLTQVLRSIKRIWIDKFQKKRFKTKGTYKNTQKSKVSIKQNKPDKTFNNNNNKTSKSTINNVP